MRIKKPVCNFCRKKIEDVRLLIRQNECHICESCVMKAKELFDESRKEQDRAARSAANSSG